MAFTEDWIERVGNLLQKWTVLVSLYSEYAYNLKYSSQNPPNPHSVPPTSLLYGARYDKIASAFGADGYSVRTVLQLDEVMKLVFSKHREGPVIINIEVDPNSTRKPQVSVICTTTL